MIENGDWMKMALYVSISVAGGILLAITGIHLADRIS